MKLILSQISEFCSINILKHPRSDDFIQHTDIKSPRGGTQVFSAYFRLFPLELTVQGSDTTSLRSPVKGIQLTFLVLNQIPVNGTLVSTTYQETAGSWKWLAFLLLSLTCLACNEQALKASVNGRAA